MVYWGIFAARGIMGFLDNLLFCFFFLFSIGKNKNMIYFSRHIK